MKYVFIALTIFLVGCTALKGGLVGIQEIAATGEANPEIRATLTFVDDIVENPWDKALAVAIGYGLALFRRWYKKKRGAQSL